MTSNHLFFKAMREDMRHKIWMAALSFLGNFLAMPVLFLMYTSNMSSPAQAWEYLNMIDFVRGVTSVAGGIVAMAEAVVVGLYGFRFVFHKNMVDAYHSLPIRRSALFGVCWLDGFLIWFIPFLANLLLTLAVAAGFLARGGEIGMIPGMLFSAATSVVMLTVLFLLVYHVALLAVMVSGNILNTLVCAGILGLGAITVYGLLVAFLSLYMKTFYSGHINWAPAAYASPLFGAGRLLFLYMAEGFSVKILAFYGLLAAALGAAAFLSYRKRASELAEQGILSRPLGAVLRTVAGLEAGLGGWMLFHLLTGLPGWGVFGAVLGTVLSFGVMDIVLHMDFKSFFAHKLHMALTAVAGLAVCFCFYCDAWGYDTYLPDREDIEEIAVWHFGWTNCRYYDGSGHSETYMLEKTHFKDADAAYAFLERMTEREKDNGNREYDSFYDDGWYDYDGNETIVVPVRVTRKETIVVPVRVTLKNGRTYYREYSVSGEDYDVVRPMLTDEAFLEDNYLIDSDEASAAFDRLEVIRGDQVASLASVPGDVSRDKLKGILDAYNEDIREDPDVLFRDRGRLMARLELSSSEGDVLLSEDGGLRVFEIQMTVYDSMERTVKALADAGLKEVTQDPDPERVSEILLGSGLTDAAVADGDLEELVDYVRAEYGLARETADETAGDGGEREENGYAESAEVWTSTDPIVAEGVSLSVTDPEEIRELMGYLNYGYENWAGFRISRSDQSVRIMLADDSGEETCYTCYIRKGELPEKYIEKFRQLFLAIRQDI